MPADRSVGGPRASAESELLRIAIPWSINELRRAEPQQAERRRIAVKDAFLAAFACGICRCRVRQADGGDGGGALLYPDPCTGPTPGNLNTARNR